jgi:hypothetical protein
MEEAMAGNSIQEQKANAAAELFALQRTYAMNSGLVVDLHDALVKKLALNDLEQLLTIVKLIAPVPTKKEPTKTVGFKKIDPTVERSWRGKQSKEYEWIGKVLWDPGGRRCRNFRVRVKVDSYDFQSYAKLEVWCQAGWSFIHQIPGQLVGERTESYSAPKDIDFHAIRDELLGIGTRVV